MFAKAAISNVGFQLFSQLVLSEVKVKSEVKVSVDN